MVGFLQHWIARDGNCDTLTALGGKDLLKKIQDIQMAKEQQQSPEQQQQK